MVSITSYYGSSASAENNAKKVSIAGNHFFFSYETLVAVRDNDGTLSVIQNYWGPTTGKHLNAIDGGSKEAKAERLTQGEFDQVVEEMALSQAAKDMFIF